MFNLYYRTIHIIYDFPVKTPKKAISINGIAFFCGDKLNYAEKGPQPVLDGQGPRLQQAQKHSWKITLQPTGGGCHQALQGPITSIPAIALLGLLIPLLGIGNKTAVTALIIYALLPMVRNTYAGIRSIDPDLIEAARGMGSTRWQILFRIKLPLAMTIILAGLRSMVVMTISAAGIASSPPSVPPAAAKPPSSSW